MQLSPFAPLEKGRPKAAGAASMTGRSLTGFARRVYAVVARIPKGKTLSYAQVAAKAGSSGAARAVGNLMNRNPFPITRVPCHRVVRADGSVGGYAWGTARKRALLRREGAIR